MNTPRIYTPPAQGKPDAPIASVGENWLAHFTAGTVSAANLQIMELPHHAPLLDRWLAESDLGFVFAARGVGKTHLCLAMARALAEGGSIGPWCARGAVPCSTWTAR